MLIANALKNGDRVLALALIHQAYPYQINQHDEDGQTPLHIAVQKHDIMIIEALLLKGAFVNAKANDPCYRLMTPLHYAALVGDWSAANLLLHWGANTQALNSQHRTPAQFAYQHGFKRVGELIEQYHVKKSTQKERTTQIKNKTLELRNSTVDTLKVRKWLNEKCSDQNNVIYLAAYRKKS